MKKVRTKCSCCGRLLDSSNFYVREDCDSLYAWCKDCMVKNARTTDYPSESKRGCGRIQFFDEDFD